MHKVCLSDLWGHGTKDMGETEWTDELEGTGEDRRSLPA